MPVRPLWQVERKNGDNVFAACEPSVIVVDEDEVEFR